MHELCVFLLLGTAQVTTLSLCDTDDGYLEVENKSDNRFTCRDIAEASTVSWLLTDVYGNDVNLGTCPPPTSSKQSSCNASDLAPVFTSYRNSSDVSFLSVDARASGNPNSWAGLPLICRTELRNYAKCFMDYIYRPTVVSCKVLFINTTWIVSGQCNISKTFSKRGRYRCRIYEKTETQGETLLFNMTMSTTPNGDGVSTSCAFQSYLPSDGRYSYRAVVIPGEAEFLFAFTGSNEIRTPSTTPSHNCPNFVQEGKDVNCACSVSDYGAPSGTLQWDNTGSTQLSLTNVTRGDTGRWFVCRLTWNDTDVLTINYTLIVTLEMPGSNSQPKSTGPIIGGVTGGVIFIALSAGVIVFCLRRKGSAAGKPHLQDTATQDGMSENRSEEGAEDYKILKNDKQNRNAKKKEAPGQVLSMSPMAGTEYQNCAFEEKQMNRKGDKDIRQLKEKQLIYTTVAFSGASSPRPTPKIEEATEYASIAAQNDVKEKP